jgi:UDP-galactopyranose mutase
MNTFGGSSRSLQRTQRAGKSSSPSTLPIVCFSHLRWGFVWQRPQHILTRLTHLHPVYFIEEPILEPGMKSPSLRIDEDHSVTILTPVLRAEEHAPGGFSRENRAVIRALLSDYFACELESPEVVAWYYTPMAFGTLPSSLVPLATVFDAMDELANFRHAPLELRDQDRELMTTADLVFTGGPSLHDLRKHRHPRAFCFPSGVDEAHFRYAGGPIPDDIGNLTSPIIGFYGVLDERVDFDLIAGIADLRPDWSFVMIGPVVKIDESELARRSNIRYLGMRTYEMLPRYLNRFDAAILPFAINEATRFISPTKTLEYLAGGKPVVSTPIRDVADLYGDVVEIAQTPEEFVAAIENQWNVSPVQEAFRQHLVKSILSEHAWDVIASRMQRLLQEVVQGRPTIETMIQDAIPTSAVRLPAAASGSGE